MISRGNTLADLIGYRFEYLIHHKYPFLDWNQKGSNLPDFSCNEFHLEVKGQCAYYGGRIKPYQIESFKTLKEPVFYIYGWHSQKGLSKMRKAVVVRNVAQMEFKEFCLIENLLIEKFFAKEQRHSKAQRKNGDNHYCILKPRHLRDIRLNSEVERNGVIVRTHDFYGLDSNEWNFDMLNGIQLLIRKSSLPNVARLVE